MALKSAGLSSIRRMLLGHAALWIEERGVLAAGDMLPIPLIPFLDLRAADPIEDYLTRCGRSRAWQTTLMSHPVTGTAP